MTDKEKIKAIDDYVRVRKEIYQQEMEAAETDEEKTVWANAIHALDGVGAILDA
jgi:hypothetical protein